MIWFWIILIDNVLEWVWCGSINGMVMIGVIGAWKSDDWKIDDEEMWVLILCNMMIIYVCFTSCKLLLIWDDLIIIWEKVGMGSGDVGADGDVNCVVKVKMMMTLWVDFGPANQNFFTKGPLVMNFRHDPALLNRHHQPLPHLTTQPCRSDPNLERRCGLNGLTGWIKGEMTKMTNCGPLTAHHWVKMTSHASIPDPDHMGYMCCPIVPRELCQNGLILSVFGLW